jgi:sigma-E factor negative regulatory protein RseC
MITEQAIVTSREGRQVELELLRQSACGGCELNRSCGTGALGRLLGHRRKPLLLESERPLQPGDRVTLSLSERALVKASLLVYGLPLCTMLLAGLLAYAAGPLAEWAIVLFSAGGFLVGFHCASRWSASWSRVGMTPEIIAVEANPQGLTRS